MFDKKSPVFCLECGGYSDDKIMLAVDKLMSYMGIDGKVLGGKNVVIKPNLLLGYAPEKAATTHPSLILAVAKYVKSYFPKSLIIAESPGGIYTEGALRRIYDVTGMTDVSEKSGVPLNFDVSAEQYSIPDGECAKNVQIISPIASADVIINCCKAKTHSLAGMTGAAKNMFGVIPGITKFEMHARFSNPENFFGMVTDLNCELSKSKKIFSICDAIECMEGNGPSGGTPKFVGRLFASENPFSLDSILAEMMGLTGSVPLIDIAAERGLVPGSVGEITVIGDEVPKDCDFVKADATMAKKFKLIPGFLKPRPVIDTSVCKGCLKCISSCPQNTIVEKNGKAFINSKKCIKCYCCQELCTFGAVRIKKSLLYKYIK